MREALAKIDEELTGRKRAPNGTFTSKKHARSAAVQTQIESGVTPKRPEGKTPFPDTLPGSFFVLAYDRLSETYVLSLDDADGSSYNMGVEHEKITHQFFLWGISAILMQRAIDYAREFGAVQVIPREDRVVRVAVSTKKPVLSFEEQNNGFSQLPPI